MFRQNASPVSDAQYGNIFIYHSQFYGAMSLVYLAYGVVWLIVSACQWRELLRIQVNHSGLIYIILHPKKYILSIHFEAITVIYYIKYSAL